MQLVGLSDEALLKLSKDNLYALNLEEMRAVRDHYTSMQAESARPPACPRTPRTASWKSLPRLGRSTASTRSFRP